MKSARCCMDDSCVACIMARSPSVNANTVVRFIAQWQRTNTYQRHSKRGQPRGLGCIFGTVAHFRRLFCQLRSAVSLPPSA